MKEKVSKVEITCIVFFISCILIVSMQDYVNKKPLVICGDYNENDEYSAVAYLKSLQMNDCLMLTGQHTHWWPLFKIPLTSQKMILRKRIDHVLVNQCYVPLSCEVLQGMQFS